MLSISIPIFSTLSDTLRVLVLLCFDPWELHCLYLPQWSCLIFSFSLVFFRWFCFWCWGISGLRRWRVWYFHLLVGHNIFCIVSGRFKFSSSLRTPNFHKWDSSKTDFDKQGKSYHAAMCTHPTYTQSLQSSVYSLLWLPQLPTMIFQIFPAHPMFLKYNLSPSKSLGVLSINKTWK